MNDNRPVTGLKRKLLTLLLYIVAAILITWAIWVGPAPRQADPEPAPSRAQPQRTSATPQT